MSNNTIEFVVTGKEVFSYLYYNPRLASDYVREDGVVSLSTTHNGKEVEVTMQTGVSYVANDYDYPNPLYEVTSIRINRVDVTRDEIEDNDLAVAICRLNQKETTFDAINYNREPEGYLYSLRDLSEEHFGEIYDKISYEKMKEKMQTGNCEIFETTIA